MHTVLRFLENLPDEQQRELGYLINDFLHQLIFPLETALKWNLPFYIHYGNLCFLNFGKDGLIIGFMRGAELTDEHGLLTATDRKLIRHLILRRPGDLYRPGTDLLFLEAAALNEQYAKR